MLENETLLLQTLREGPYLIFLVIGVTVCVIGSMLWQISVALRAKRRAQHAMQLAKTEAAFRDLIRKAYRSDLASHDADMDRLRLSVETHLKSMSDADRQLVKQGLHQRNRRGSDRYLKDLIGFDKREFA